MISLSWIIGNAVTILLLGGWFAAWRWGRRWRNERETASYSQGGRTERGILANVAFFGSFVAAVATLGIYVAATWPTFDMQYHSYKQVSGSVQAVSSRFLGDGKSTTQNFAVTIAGHDYRCDDTRCALVKVGDTLTLSCIREWQYAGTSGYDCNFVSDEPGG